MGDVTSKRITSDVASATGRPIAIGFGVCVSNRELSQLFETASNLMGASAASASGRWFTGKLPADSAWRRIDLDRNRARFHLAIRNTAWRMPVQQMSQLFARVRATLESAPAGADDGDRG